MSFLKTLTNLLSKEKKLSDKLNVFYLDGKIDTKRYISLIDDAEEEDSLGANNLDLNQYNPKQSPEIISRLIWLRDNFGTKGVLSPRYYRIKGQSKYYANLGGGWVLSWHWGLASGTTYALHKLLNDTNFDYYILHLTSSYEDDSDYIVEVWSTTSYNVLTYAESIEVLNKAIEQAKKTLSLAKEQAEALKLKRELEEEIKKIDTREKLINEGIIEG